ncbi:hypothetical protein VNO77_22031 [Canavalia gladiata]|uniref:Uncharacterized protein n=1 Tax=Canavalia gladiata TaxID=3824 RepID=A0AAN9L711_CANGL
MNYSTCEGPLKRSDVNPSRVHARADTWEDLCVTNRVGQKTRKKLGQGQAEAEAGREREREREREESVDVSCKGLNPWLT